MTLEEIIRSGLLANAGVYALLGTNLFLVQLPEDAFDSSINPPGGTPPNTPTARAVYQRLTTQRIYAHASANNVGWSVFRFTIWDYTGISTLNIAQAIVAALADFTAQLEDSPPSPNAPNFVLSQRMDVEPQTDPPLFKTVMDVRFFFEDQ